MKDLLILVADEDTRAVIEVLLVEKYRYQLGIRKLSFEILKHQNRDPGVRMGAAEIFRIRYGEFHKGLVILDYEGSGFKGKDVDLEIEIKKSIVKNTPWNEKDVEVVVINPELEIWVWGVADKLGEVFNTRLSILRKPDKSKEELENLLEKVDRPHSSALFREIAKKVNRNHVDNCRDRAFKKLVDTLRGWFGVSSS